MAAVASPVELPTSRNSVLHVETSGDMNDPQWIPVLRTVELHYGPSQEKELLPYTGATFSPVAPYTADAPQPQLTPKPSSIHSYSRSSVAPETVELEAASPLPAVPLPPLPPIPPPIPRQMNFELPATRPTSWYFEKAHITDLSGDATLASTDTETTGDASRSESTADTATTTEDAALGGPPPKVKAEAAVPAPPSVKEETPSLYPRSTRSSYSSTKKHSVGPPTSKFNRTPAPALPSRITSLQSGANPPSLTPSPSKSPAQSRTPTPAASPRLTAFPPQSDNPKAAPSSVSNKAASLQPKSSNTSLASQSSDKATPAATQIPTPVTEPAKYPPRTSSASLKAEQARTSVGQVPLSLSPPLVMAQEGAGSLAEEPRPSSVTPEPEMARLETPERARLAPHAQPGPSTGISSFMTANDTVIFRRFDKVHVQLLLCLQDEITQLERELLRFESAIITRSERDAERSRVIRELRKVVAEYDHLFSSWSQMQASKASKATQQSLRTWLERPSSKAGQAVTPKDELHWLNQSKDLSAVSLRQANGKSSGGGVGNFMASICGKRK